MHTYLNKILVLVIIYLNLGFTQQGKWVVGHGKAVAANITIEQAKYKAIQQARKNALSKLGILVKAQTEYFNMENDDRNADTFFELIQTQTNARILKEDTLDWQVAISDEVPVYSVSLRIYAVTRLEKSDPTFKLSLKLNKKTYHSGDEMRIKVKSTKDSYVYLFNITNSDTLIQLFPNNLQKRNFVRADHILNFPPDSLKNIMEFSVVTKKISPSKELILAVAARKKIPFGNLFNENSEMPFPYLLLKKYAFFDLNKWLIQFNNSEITEATEVYVVYPN